MKKELQDLFELLDAFKHNKGFIELRIFQTTHSVVVDNRLADMARMIAIRKIKRDIDLLENKYEQELERDADVSIR